MIVNRYEICSSCCMKGICSAIVEKFGDSAVKRRDFLRGETFMRSSLDGVAVLLSGLAISYFNDPHGQKEAIVIVDRGDVIGETGALIREEAADYLFFATDAASCFFARGNYCGVLREQPTLLFDVVQAATRNTSNFSFMSWMLQGSSVCERIERFMAYYYVRNSTGFEENFIIPLSHETLSLIVNAERATVSRALERLSKDGMLNLRQNAIIINVGKWTDSISVARNLANAKDTLSARSISLE